MKNLLFIFVLLALQFFASQVFAENIPYEIKMIGFDKGPIRDLEITLNGIKIGQSDENGTATLNMSKTSVGLLEVNSKINTYPSRYISKNS